MPARKLAFSLSARSGWEDGYSGSDISVGVYPRYGVNMNVCCYGDLDTRTFHEGLEITTVYRVCVQFNVSSCSIVGRFCMYPQELILQLHGMCHVRQLQLLSHQYLIGKVNNDPCLT